MPHSSNPNIPAAVSRLIWISLAIIFALNIYIYARAAHGPYLVDDYPNLVNNDYLIIKKFNIENIKNALLSSPASSFYRPLSMFSFAINYTLAGDKSPRHIKITNIFIHIVTGLGIFLLTINLLPRLKNRAFINRTLINRTFINDDTHISIIALLTTCAWLCHPLFVSTVLYSVQRMAMLSTLFIVYGCLVYIHLRTQILLHNTGHLKLYLSVSLLTCLAFLAKENGILLPGFLVLIELFCFGFVFHKHTPPFGRTSLKLFLAIPVLFVLGYLIFTYFSLMHEPPTSYYFTVYERFITQARVLWRYAGWLLFVNPEPMGIYHDDIVVSTGLLDPITTLLSIAAWTGVMTAACIYFKSRSVLVFCILWFLWGHILEASVIPLSIAFEHRNYLPGYGLILGLAILITYYLDSLRIAASLKYLTAVVIFLILPAYALQERVDGWTDRKTLTLRLLSNKPDSAQTMTLVAQFLSDSGDYEGAVQAVKIAQMLDKNESAHILAEIALHCERNPHMKFNRQLIDKMSILPLSTASTVFTANQFRIVTRICHQSTINDDLLLNLYQRFSNNKNNQISMLAHYGIGVIYLNRGNYSNTISSWEQAIKIHKYATGLKLTLEKLKSLHQQDKHE